MAERLHSPRDLTAVPVIRDANSMVLWETWLKATGHADVKLATGPTFSDASLCLDAAIAGQGVMLGWPILGLDAVADGRLVLPFPQQVETSMHYWFVTPAERRTPAKVKLFCDWMRQALSDSLSRVPLLKT